MVQLARGHASKSFTTDIFSGSSTSPSEYALAFYSGLWAYDGWDQANYVGGEVKNPEKNIPRTIHLSMILVIVSNTYAFLDILNFFQDTLFTSKHRILRRSRQGIRNFHNL